MTEREKRNLRRQVEGLYGRIAKLKAERDALRARLAEAEARVKGLEAAIYTECRRCALHHQDLGGTKSCDWNGCPLWPYRPGDEEGEG